MQLPYGTYGHIATRSSAAWKLGLDVGAGVIDSDYRGDIIIIAFNHSNHLVHIAPGQCVAQIILETYLHPPIHEIMDLSSTTRGTSGFGSTDQASSSYTDNVITPVPQPKPDIFSLLIPPE